MKKTIIILIVAVCAVGAIFWLVGRVNSTPASTALQTNYVPATDSVPAPAADTGATADAVMTVNVTGQNFSFSPAIIRVKKGTSLKINYTDTDGFHDLILDGYNLHTSRLQTGQSAVLQFTADKTGTFAYYCSVGTHRASGMEGRLIVE